MNLIDGIKSDWIYITGFRRIIGAIGKFDPEEEYTVADAIEDAVDDHDDRVFISFEGQDISYAEFDKRANQRIVFGARRKRMRAASHRPAPPDFGAKTCVAGFCAEPKG